MIEKISGKLICIRDDEEYVNETVTIELTDFEKDGSVELAFDDRKERVYISFRLQDVLQRIAAVHGAGD
jgi:hypothetical protein